MLFILGVIILKPIMLLYGRPKVHNRAALKSKGKVIYVSNHVKMSDPLWIVCITSRMIHFMAKSKNRDTEAARTQIAYWKDKLLATLARVDSLTFE